MIRACVFRRSLRIGASSMMLRVRVAGRPGIDSEPLRLQFPRFPIRPGAGIRVPRAAGRGFAGLGQLASPRVAPWQVQLRHRAPAARRPLRSREMRLVKTTRRLGRRTGSLSMSLRAVQWATLSDKSTATVGAIGMPPPHTRTETCHRRSRRSQTAAARGTALAQLHTRSRRKQCSSTPAAQ